MILEGSPKCSDLSLDPPDPIERRSEGLRSAHADYPLPKVVEVDDVVVVVPDVVVVAMVVEVVEGTVVEVVDVVVVEVVIDPGESIGTMNLPGPIAPLGGAVNPRTGYDDIARDM